MPKQAIVIKGKAKPGQRATVLALFERHLAERARSNSAQEIVCWCADENDGEVFHLFEVYTNKESFQAAASAPWFASYMQEAGPLLAAPPEFAMATLSWAKGVAP